MPSLMFDARIYAYYTNMRHSGMFLPILCMLLAFSNCEVVRFSYSGKTHKNSTMFIQKTEAVGKIVTFEFHFRTYQPWCCPQFFISESVVPNNSYFQGGVFPDDKDWTTVYTDTGQFFDISTMSKGCTAEADANWLNCSSTPAFINHNLGILPFDIKIQ